MYSIKQHTVHQICKWKACNKWTPSHSWVFRRVHPGVQSFQYWAQTLVPWIYDTMVSKPSQVGILPRVCVLSSVSCGLGLLLYIISCWHVLLIVYRFCKPSDESKRQQKVAQILEKLIILTIEEVEMYPSIQAKIWGSIGQVCYIFWLYILNG